MFFKLLKEALKVKQVRSKILFTIFIILVFRIGTSITVPGVNAKSLEALSGLSFLNMLSLVSGNAMKNFSVFALGVSPYITASIVVQLLQMDILPKFVEWGKQGEVGRRKLNQATRYIALVLAFVQSIGITAGFNTLSGAKLLTTALTPQVFVTIGIILTAGSMIVTWLGEQITDKGYGNGVSMIIFAGIVIAAVIDSGYTSRNERVSVTFAAGMLSTLCLLFIYGGLIYLGATTDYPLTDSVQRTELLLHISHSVLGKWGTITVALAIGFACLTTAIALTSAVGLFSEEVTHQRIPYKVGAIACTLISLVLSINTVDNIINYAIYILLFIYPIVSTLIIIVLFFDRFVNSKLPYILSILVTAIISTIDSCQTLGLPFDKLYEIKSLLPLSDYGLEWFLPALLTFIITAFIKDFKKK